MDGPLVSTVASVSVRDGDYLLLLVVAAGRTFFGEGETEGVRTCVRERKKERKKIKQREREIKGAESAPEREIFETLRSKRERKLFNGDGRNGREREIRNDPVQGPLEGRIRSSSGEVTVGSFGAVLTVRKQEEKTLPISVWTGSLIERFR